MSVLFKKVPLKTLDAMEKALEKDPDRVREACLELEQPDENGLPILCSDDSVFSMLFDLLESVFIALSLILTVISLITYIAQNKKVLSMQD